MQKDDDCLDATSASALVSITHHWNKNEAFTHDSVFQEVWQTRRSSFLSMKVKDSETHAGAGASAVCHIRCKIFVDAQFHFSGNVLMAYR
jgi:hypothetical protein